MLFAGWEVLIVKNCDRDLRNAFLSPRSQFFTIWTDPKPVNWFTEMGLLCNFVIELAYVHRTIRKQSKKRTSG